jgi:hypothetical protein
MPTVRISEVTEKGTFKREPVASQVRSRNYCFKLIAEKREDENLSKWNSAEQRN